MHCVTAPPHLASSSPAVGSPPAGFAAHGFLFAAVSSSDATLALCAASLSLPDAAAAGDVSFAGGRHWRNVARLQHHACPVPSLAYVAVPFLGAGSAGSQLQHLLFSGATDGEVAAWDVSEAVAAHAAESAAAAAAAAAAAVATTAQQQQQQEQQQERRPRRQPKPPSELAPALVLRGAHQSGVNALSASLLRLSNPLSTSTAASASAEGAAPLVVILSGGDDAALSACVLSAGAGAGAGPLRCEAAVRCAAAHSSALKGAVLSADGSAAFTAGLDQRVCHWCGFGRSHTSA